MSALTKMLIVLQLVFSLVCSVLLVLMVSKQENYKTQYDNANTRAIAASATVVKLQADAAAQNGQLTEAKNGQTAAILKATVADTARVQAISDSEADISKLNSQIATLTAANSVASASNSTLANVNKAQNDELMKVRPQVATLTTQLMEIIRQLNETTNQLHAAENAIKRLQEAQVAGTAPGGAAAPMGSESQITALGAGAPAAKVNGQISEVNTTTGSTLIGLPLGTRDGINANTKLAIYRGNSYVGDAVVQRATPDESVAIVVSTKPGATVQKGDLVSTVNQ